MAVTWESPSEEISEPVRAKLEAFARLRGEFEICFAYVEDVHGQRRVSPFPVEGVVRYLHALWICECKDRLLSVPKTIERYEGPQALALLRGWQHGDTASVVAFLHGKLDSLPFADLTLQIQNAYAAGQIALAARLTHGRMTLLNRAINLNAALDSMFSLSLEALLEQVGATSVELGYTPDRIEEELAALATRVFAYLPHPVLARENILVMNAAGIQVTDNEADRPGERTSLVEAARMPLPGYAEQVIAGEHVLSSMRYNNPRRLDEAMPPLSTDAPQATQPPDLLTGPQWTGQ